MGVRVGITVEKVVNIASRRQELHPVAASRWMWCGREDTLRGSHLEGKEGREGETEEEEEEEGECWSVDVA